MVETGPVLENVLTGDDVNVLKFPAPKWHEDDGGRYIGTECMVITKDPDSDWVNAGTYRVQVHDDKTLSIFIEPGKDGDTHPQEVLGARRALSDAGQRRPGARASAAAGSTPPKGVWEFALAGGRLGRPIELVKGQFTGIPFPADCELVFEGFCRRRARFPAWKARSANGRATTLHVAAGAGAAGEGDLSSQ